MIPWEDTMDSLLIASLIFIILLALLALFTKLYAAFWYKILVSDKLEVVNILMTTEDVPPKWRLKIIEKIARRNKASSFCKFISAVLKRWYILRLKRMLFYIRRSSLIKGQDKKDYISAFQEMQKDWAGGSIDI
jgi:hypothetical protein